MTLARSALRTSSLVSPLSALFSLSVCVGLLSGCSSAPESNEKIGESSLDLTSDSITANEQAAYEFFVAKGLTPVQSAGIVGNLMQESNVVPSAVQPGGPGRGIAQWSVGGRWNASSKDNMAWYAAQHGLSTSTLTAQLDFVWYELTTFSGYGLASLKSATTISTATEVFEKDYEGCGTCDQSNRIAYAQKVYAANSSSAAVGCYSGTLGKEVPENTCVQSKSDDLWYQCDEGSWVTRKSDPEACASEYPLE